MTTDADGITHLPEFHCPRCGHLMDAVGTSDGTPVPPSPGDVSGCMACGFPMIFIDVHGDGALSLRPLTAAEFDALPDDNKQELARVQWFARHVYQPQRASRN